MGDDGQSSGTAMDDEDDDNMIHYPTGYSRDDIFSWGSIGMVVSKPGSHFVVKWPHGKSEQRLIDVERRIYERFEQHHSHEGVLR
jgi:hypothetical protein